MWVWGGLGVLVWVNFGCVWWGVWGISILLLGCLVCGWRVVIIRLRCGWSCDFGEFVACFSVARWGLLFRMRLCVLLFRFTLFVGFCDLVLLGLGLVWGGWRFTLRVRFEFVCLIVIWLLVCFWGFDIVMGVFEFCVVVFCVLYL